jgi:protein-L-isoaspartate(D-aspartate) O-methyltransferase
MVEEDVVDFAIQRTNMVESQVRPSDVTDRRIIRAMREVPRELFVPARMRPLAYMDGPVQLLPSSAAGPRRSLLSARIFAKLVQAAGIEPEGAVLDVGAATGYSSAILARLGASVVALECDPSLLNTARETLPQVGAGQVMVVEGDLAQGWVSEGPYDAIVVEGAIETVPADLLDQLKDGGRLVAIVGGNASGVGASGRATVWRRGGGSFGASDVFDATGDVLPGFEKPHEFAF